MAARRIFAGDLKLFPDLEFGAFFIESINEVKEADGSGKCGGERRQ